MMSPGDQMLAGENVSEPGKGTLLEKMKWVRATAESHVIDGLNVGDVCDQLEGVEEEGDSEGEDEDDSDEEEYEQNADGAARLLRNYDGGLTKDAFDFEACAAEVDFIINHKYSSLSGSKQYEKAFDAFHEIQALISVIAKHVGSESPFMGKVRALRALINIGLSVVGSEGDVVAHEIRTLFASDDEIPKLIVSIVKSVEKPARSKMGFEDELASLVEDAQSYGIDIFDELADPAVMLNAGP